MLNNALCEKGNKVYMVCMNQNCKNKPFMCHECVDFYCQETHLKCKTISWRNLLKIIHQKRKNVTAQAQSQFQQMDRIFKSTITQLQNQYQKFKLHRIYFGLGQLSRNFLQVLEKKQYDKLNGQYISKLYNQITSPNGKRLKQKQQLFREYQDIEKQVHKIKQSLNSLYSTYNCSQKTFRSSNQTKHRIQDKLNHALSRPDILNSLKSSRCFRKYYNLFWSKNFKSPTIIISQNIATQNKQHYDSQNAFILLQPKLENRFIWAVKLLKGTMSVGICHKSAIIKNKYTFNAYQMIGHGSYMINEEGICFSNHDKDFNNRPQSFEFEEGDTINMEYLPSEKKLKFGKKNTLDTFELDIKINSNDQIYACVALEEEYSEIQLILLNF